VTDFVDDEIAFLWRGTLEDEELVDLVASHGGVSEHGWWSRVSPHSLGWVTARSTDGMLVGFVNVAWDGSGHAFLIDTKTRGSYQRRRIGVRLVQVAAHAAKASGCEWLHVDFEPHLRAFYLEACGFIATEAGLIHLPNLGN
jgi:ribosomal protein S18 acetylase RimI-like enzyme